MHTAVSPAGRTNAEAARRPEIYVENFFGLFDAARSSAQYDKDDPG